MPLIGTAGHVDHGKSTLVIALTGRDPDRWAEEKRRGLTIDLGFAWATLPGGLEVSFVDVPGHERFLKNMLAGIEAIEIALFVVAADEGWMPQSEEHLAVLDLLEVNRGVVALTKADAADPSLVELAMTEIAERLHGTTLEGAAIVPVSGVTGQGVDELTHRLVDLLHHTKTTDTGRPRLWVDRSFNVRGAGTVVTGSLLGGRLEIGQTVEISPSGHRARIRSLQSHEREVSSVGPGRRVAVNLSGISREEVKRGDMLGLPSDWDMTDRVAAVIGLPRYESELRRRGAYQIHLGTAVREMRVVALDGVNAILALDRPVPASVGDRFVIRDTGRRRVVAGGRILDPSPPAAREALASAGSIDPDASPNSVAQALLEVRGQETAERLRAHSGGGWAVDAVSAGESVVSNQYLTQLSDRAVATTRREHERNPLRPGIPIATLGEKLDVTATIADLVVDTDSRLERIGPNVRLAGFSVVLDNAAGAAWESAKARLAQGLDVPKISELGIDTELAHLKIREGELVRINTDLAYLPEQVDRLKDIIRGLGANFTVADFRDAAGLSRKYAVPILEWADSQGLTTRRGDVRRVN